MAISQKIIKFLGKAKVKYEPIEHRTVYTAYDKAATLKVLQRIIGKTLVVKFNGKFALVLIPANKNLDKGKFKKIAKAQTIDFVTEAWMKKRLIGVKVGAIPPLGSLWKLPTFIDKTLLREPKIFINAGNYNFSLRIRGADLRKLLPDLIVGSFDKKK